MRIGVTARPAIALYYSGRALGEHYETLQVVSTRDDHENRVRSPIHYGAVWLQVIEKPAQKLEGHYWTDRNTAGELRLTDRRKQKFQDFNSAKAHDER